MDLVTSLLSQLDSALLIEYAQSNGISEKLDNWRGRLQVIQAVMDSAEERQMKGDPTVDRWLADLRDVAYDMEDLLNEFSIDARRNPPKVQTCSPKLPSSLISFCSRMNPCTLLSDMENQIKQVDQRLDQLIQQKGQLVLAQNFRAPSPFNSNKPHFTTTSVLEPLFFGGGKQTQDLLPRLVCSDSANNNDRPFTIVSIVGMAGLGKTTLAQVLYNHGSVREAFDLRAWTCVSSVFDSIAITTSILTSVAPSVPFNRNDLDLLQNTLKEQLSGKKFLIVLDDIWSENYEQLESLFKPFYSGSRGSRVLLTTRNLEVAKLAGDRHPIKLDLLSSEDCFYLLAYHAIGQRSFECQPQLQDTAFQLAEKCKGLPLSAKIIGSLLRSERDMGKWKGVLDHYIWNIEGKIPPALKLRYIYLPIQLKRCFAACGLFPKSHMFDRDEMIRVWIMLGLLQKGTAKTYRDVGIEYFSQLKDLSFFQQIAGDKFSMPDLINDLAESVIGTTYFHHEAFVMEAGERCLASKLDVYCSMKKLRAFIPFQSCINSYPNVYVSHKVIHYWMIHVKYIRVLSLRYFRISKVPYQISKLKYLRSIDLSYTSVRILPESICDLINLESLMLRECRRLKRFPKDIHKLSKLINLDITGVDNLEETPPNISRLVNLEILSTFVVSKGAGQGLKELGPLEGLSGCLHIHNLIVVDDVEDARVADLCKKKAVSDLILDWRADYHGISRDSEHELKLLDNLRPPEKIERLEIRGYGGKELSSWFDGKCLNCVTSITLKGCKSVKSLPPLGNLPLLKSLEISNLDAMSRIGVEFYGTKMSFWSLSSLTFRDMPAWEEWSSGGAYGEVEQPFPCLRQLRMEHCPLLKTGLPKRLDSLYQLVIQGCPLLETSGDSLRLPSLREMEIRDCNNALLKCLVEVTSMTLMTISCVKELVYFNRKFSTSWASLEEIRIGSCPHFKSLVYRRFRKQVLPMLKRLRINSCDDLEKLPDDLCLLPSLNEVKISGCEKFSTFPSEGLPPTLRTLSLTGCPALPTSQFRILSTRPPEAFEDLFLEDLEGLISMKDLISDAQYSQSLRRLSISKCRSLKTLLDDLQHLSRLTELRVKDCPVLELGCFPDLPCRISKFELNGYQNVSSLPHNMKNIASLTKLDVSNCSGITSFPKGGLPRKLVSLRVYNCNTLKQPLEKWGLTRLGDLREFTMGGEMECVDRITCFPSSLVGRCAWGSALPSSLVKLEILWMNKTERLAGGLRNHLTSLQELRIIYCEKMKLLPKEGLPESLEEIEIVGCPLLSKRCDEEENGKYWPLLQRIPFVDID